MADQQPAEREMVFCHECENEWYRDEHGLTCPDCHSEFTEIIEAEHDPRDDHITDQEIENPFAGHNPWDAPDPEEGVPDFMPGFRVQRNGPNSYAITGTWSTSFGGPGEHNGGQNPPNPLNPLLRNFTTMMQNIAGGMPPTPQGEQRQGQQEGQAQPGAAQEETRQGAGPRFSYTSTARLFPRDANNPGAHVNPADDLHHVITGLLGGGAFGPPPFPPGAGMRDDTEAGSPGRGGGGPPRTNPLAALFASILNPQLAAHGDAVYTQEALDRVISQLMEQNATGNAPGPASEEAIAALPKKKVTRQMLGDDAPADWPEEQLKGDCSICMDEVHIGDEVTELPCTHWFHGPCIEAWLKEHDTCPHCRKGIEKKDQGQRGSGDDSSRPSGGGSSAGSSSSGAGPGNDRSSPFGGPATGTGNPSNENHTQNVPNMPGGWQAAGNNVRVRSGPGYDPYDDLFARTFALALLRPRVTRVSGYHINDPFYQPREHPRRRHFSVQMFPYAPEEDLMIPHHIHRPAPPPRRRRSSLSRWASNMGIGSSASADGGSRDRPGLGERIRRTLFGTSSS